MHRAFDNVFYPKRSRTIFFDIMPVQNKNSLVEHPCGGIVFGYVKGVQNKRYSIAEGPVVLRKGNWRHFGLDHIWHRHAKELEPLGYNSKSDAVGYVAKIFQNNTPVYTEELAAWEKSKLFALRGAVGYAVLKEISLLEFATAYSIVTAYPKPRPGGTRATVIIGLKEYEILTNDH